MDVIHNININQMVSIPMHRMVENGYQYFQSNDGYYVISDTSFNIVTAFNLSTHKIEQFNTQTDYVIPLVMTGPVSMKVNTDALRGMEHAQPYNAKITQNPVRLRRPIMATNRYNVDTSYFTKKIEEVLKGMS